MENLSKRIDTSANGMGQLGASKTIELGQRIEKASQDVGREVGSAVGHAAKTASAYVRQTGDYIDAHPKTSLAVAAVAGLAIGSLLTMTLRQRR